MISVYDNQMGSSEDLTDLLNRWASGDANVGDEAFRLVYAELRRIASSHLRRERTRDLLQTTAVVHEAYLALNSQHGLCWRDREHFFAFAAHVMRRVLVNLVRLREREKRGAGAIHLTLSQAEEATQSPPAEVLRVHEALVELETFDLEKARLVELRFFGGLSNAEAAQVLGLSPATANRRWRVARAWIFNYLKAS